MRKTTMVVLYLTKYLTQDEQASIILTDSQTDPI